MFKVILVIKQCSQVQFIIQIFYKVFQETSVNFTDSQHLLLIRFLSQHLFLILYKLVATAERKIPFKGKNLAQPTATADFWFEKTDHTHKRNTQPGVTNGKMLMQYYLLLSPSCRRETQLNTVLIQFFSL